MHCCSWSDGEENNVKVRNSRAVLGRLENVMNRRGEVRVSKACVRDDVARMQQ